MEEVPKMQGAYPGLLKLAFLDAAPHSLWEINTPTGGANGSIRFSEELQRPENKVGCHALTRRAPSC